MALTPSDIAVAAPLRRSPSFLTLISIAAVAAAVAGIAREVIGHAIAVRLGGADWVSTSTVFAQINTPERLAGACGTLANLVLGGMAALLVGIEALHFRLVFLVGLRVCQLDELRASPVLSNYGHR
jgi:hypothetical protein